MHPLARTTPLIRAEIVALVAGGEPVAEVARRFAVSRETVYKWLRRFRRGGEAALVDRQPIAKRFPSKIPVKLIRAVSKLRRSRRLLGWQIAVALSMARSTVIKILKKLGMARIKDLEPPRLTQRYEYQRPGELVHIDIKKLGRFAQVGHRIHGNLRRRSRGAGYDVVYVAVDDASRYGTARIYDNEDAGTAAAFLRYVAAAYKRRGVHIERVMTDNGKVFTSFAFQAVLTEIGARHILTPVYTPQWNGKAERFIQTMLREWAYAISYQNSDDRMAVLPAWLKYYNQERQHSAINYLTPALRWRQIRQQSA